MDVNGTNGDATAPPPQKQLPTKSLLWVAVAVEATTLRHKAPITRILDQITTLTLARRALYQIQVMLSIKSNMRRRAPESVMYAYS